MLRPIAFLFVSPGADPQTCYNCFPTDVHEMYIVGCNDIDAACEKAAELVDQGIKLLELCGAFGEEGCRKIIKAIDGRIPVGYLTFFPEEQEKRERWHASLEKKETTLG